MGHSPASHTEPLRHDKWLRKLKTWKHHVQLLRGHATKHSPETLALCPYTSRFQLQVSVSLLQKAVSGELKLQLACLASSGMRAQEEHSSLSSSGPQAT